MVAVRSGSVSFAHPLLASTLLDMHTSEERRAAHLALADALDDPDERALHLGHGTETASETVAMALETSAGRVDGRGAPETAAVLAERAAALTPPSDVAGTTRRLLKAADLYQAAGEGRDHVLPLLEHLAGSLPAGPDRARAQVRAGDLDRAEAHAEEFLLLDRQLRGDLGAEWYPSGLVAMHAGRIEDARRILSAGVEEARSFESTVWLAHHLGALGHLELVVGDLDAARAALDPVIPMLRETSLGEWSVHPVHPDAIETLVGLGELDEATALHAELEEYGRRLDRPWGIATAARSEALVASARGEVERALAAAERALVEHARLDWPLERARTLLVRGEILRRLGRRRDAAASLGEARTAFETLRTPLWIARVEAEEGRLGGRRRTTDTLTPTEERVAELAAQGLRNAEIAARLHVTRKTVEATLSRVYRKLGIRSRTELARRETTHEPPTADGSGSRGSPLRRIT